MTLTERHSLVRVCLEAADAPTARQICVEQQPDIAVLDVAIPRGNGIDFIKDLICLQRTLRVIVVSEREDVLTVQRAFAAGARAYVSKHEDPRQLQASIECVVQGGIFASRRVSHLLFQAVELSDARKQARANLQTLSDRELEIFRIIAHGLHPTAIAVQLNLSVKTIETHQRRMREKLHISCAGELRRCAESWLKEST